MTAAKRASGGKPAKPQVQRRLFVLDTNVLMHDPTAIFRFQEHDVYLPMVVLEELDANKKGLSEASRNVRQVSRFLDDLMRDATKDEIDVGLPLPSTHGIGINDDGDDDGDKPGTTGRLFFQTRQLSSALPDYLPGHGADNAILSQTLALQALHHESRVTLVSKDINLRIKAAVVGVHAEDYYSDKTIEDADVLYTGLAPLPANFWEAHGKDMRSWKEAERTYYEVAGPVVTDLHVNEFVHEDSSSGIEAIVRRIEAGKATLELARDYRSERHSVWGVNARNREQNFALNLLMDPEIDFVTILGPAGTGKTLLTLAAGLMQTLESNRFVEIIMTRVTIPLGEDIGFLPGTEEEKMEPWMGALMDNLEVLTRTRRRRQLGTRRHQRPAAQSHQDPLVEFHARPDFPEPLRDPRRGAKPDPQADEGPGDQGWPGHQDCLPRQHRADRHALPHRNHLRPHLRGQSLPRLGAFRPYHAGPRRTLTPGRFRL